MSRSRTKPQKSQQPFSTAKFRPSVEEPSSAILSDWIAWHSRWRKQLKLKLPDSLALSGYVWHNSAMPKPPDPVLAHSRREACVALLLWFVSLVYTVGYCTFFGYRSDDQELRFVLGMPEWFAWGVMAPWTVMLVASWWFAFGFMTDDSLE